MYMLENLKKQINVNDYVISVNSNNTLLIDAFNLKTKKILLMEGVMFNQYKDVYQKKCLVNI